MIDTKLITLITLIDTKSTIQTAHQLHITQPAVSQHIKALEQEYACILFEKKGRNLVCTEKGKILYNFAHKIIALESKIQETLHQEEIQTIHFGVTKSIAEGIMPYILPKMTIKYPSYNFNMMTENTKNLLDQLNHAQIQFALFEGNIKHTNYTCLPFMQANFIAICKKNGQYSKIQTIDELLKAPLCIREQGSGSRQILEHLLHSFDIELKDFYKVHEIASIPTILSMVKQDLAIAFIYKEAFDDPNIQTLLPDTFHVSRSFTFVMIPDLPDEEIYKQIYQDINDELISLNLDIKNKE